MKKIISICVVALTALSGCTQDSQVELNSQPENIRAFFIANNSIYAVGDLHSYQFAPDKFSDTEKLVEYLNSPPMSAVEKVTLGSIKQNVDEASGPISVTVKFELNKQKLVKALHKEAEADRYQAHPVHSFYLDKGKLVELKNKNEILAKNKLKQPLTTNFSQYTYKTTFDPEATKWLGVAVVSVPVYAVLSPFATLGYLISDH